MAAMLENNTAGPTGAPEPTGLEVHDLKVFHGVVPAVRGVDLECKPGEILGIVGPNGAGKTTIIKLLTRLYDPTEGQILLDGVDLRDYDLHDLTVNLLSDDQLTKLNKIGASDL